MLMDNNMDNLIINNLKSLSIDMINNAKSGHPGIALGATKIIYILYKYHMNVNYKDANWLSRDRFVLSAGHGSSLLYSMLYYAGFLELEDLKIGMRLQGTVRNVVDFGAFIDIGLHEDGLVHISKITNKYIKHPSEVLSVGDIVDCYVDEIKLDKKKVSLTLIKN